jgi:hypothetical protein
MKAIVLLIVMAGLVAIYLNTYTSDAQTDNNILEPVYTSFALVAYGGELSQVHDIVGDFLQLRNSPHGIDAKLKATELDNKVNSLEIVKKYCNQKISTLDLALQNDPYGKLQEICPALKSLQLSRAAQLFGKL